MPGTGDNQGGAPDPKPGESEKKYTQEELQHSINAALAKEKSRTDKKVAAAVEEALTAFLGERDLSEQDLDELVAIRSGQKEEAAKSSAELSKLQREHKKLLSEHETLLAERDKYRSAHHTALTTGAIKDHASKMGVHSVDDVVALLSPFVRVGDDDTPVVYDANGDPTHLTVEQLVKQRVESTPYLQQRAAREGAGSMPPTSNGKSGKGGPDWSTPEGKREILRALDEEGRLR